jgi:hypothetical protein
MPRFGLLRHSRAGETRGRYFSTAVPVACCLLIATTVIWMGLSAGVAEATPLYWSVTASPSPGSLEGVTCSGGSSCVAVGTTYGSSVIETWDGSAWSVVPHPDPGGSNDYLTSVWCDNPSDCVAVGVNGAGDDASLIESWDGTEWTVVPNPGPGLLLGLSCTGPQSCVAVGYQYVGDYTQTFIESWDGTTWSVVPSPSPGTGNEGGGTNQLTGVSCTDSANCVAVGEYGDESFGNASPTQTLIEQWDGSQWSVVPSPDPDSGDNSLAGITCVTATDCMAVGRDAVGSKTYPLIESWNGETWTTAPSPGDGQLNAISCTGTSDCVAVGASYAQESQHATFVESWNGTSWAATASPNVGKYSNDLYGVSCTSTSTCVGVGSGSGTLILTGTDFPAPTITSIKPSAGKVGRQVTISGKNLSSASEVTFGGTAALVLADTSTEITTRIPAGARTGHVEVMTGGGLAASPKKFKVKKS